MSSQTNSNENPQHEENFQKNQIFCGGIANIPYNDVKDYLEKFGKVLDITMITNKVTTSSRGFCFVTLDSQEAYKNIIHIEHHEICGKTVQIKPALNKESSLDYLKYQKNRKIFIHNLPTNIKKDVLYKYFKKYGKIEDIKIVGQDNKSKRSIYCFITFKQKEDVDNVLRYTNRHYLAEIDLKVFVSKAMLRKDIYEMIEHHTTLKAEKKQRMGQYKVNGGQGQGYYGDKGNGWVNGNNGYHMSPMEYVKKEGNVSQCDSRELEEQFQKMDLNGSSGKHSHQTPPDFHVKSDYSSPINSKNDDYYYNSTSQGQQQSQEYYNYNDQYYNNNGYQDNYYDYNNYGQQYQDNYYQQANTQQDYNYDYSYSNNGYQDNYYQQPGNSYYDGYSYYNGGYSNTNEQDSYQYYYMDQQNQDGYNLDLDYLSDKEVVLDPNWIYQRENNRQENVEVLCDGMVKKQL